MCVVVVVVVGGRGGREVTACSGSRYSFCWLGLWIQVVFGYGRAICSCGCVLLLSVVEVVGKLLFVQVRAIRFAG